MSWFKRHLNWTYGLVLLVGIAILIYVGFIQNNVIGYIVYISIAIVGGFLMLWAKSRLNVGWVYIVLFFSNGFGFPIAVLCLKNKRGVKPSAAKVAQDNLREASWLQPKR